MAINRRIRCLQTTRAKGIATGPVASVGVSPTELRAPRNGFGETPKAAGRTPALPIAPTPTRNVSAEALAKGEQPLHQRPVRLLDYASSEIAIGSELGLDAT